jgi:hypothetical protein
VMLLGRFGTDLADGPDVRALLVVDGDRPAHPQREIEPKMVRVDRGGLCAPDRERGVASPCSGAGQGPPRTRGEEGETEDEERATGTIHEDSGDAGLIPLPTQLGRMLPAPPGARSARPMMPDWRQVREPTRVPSESERQREPSRPTGRASPSSPPPSSHPPSPCTAPPALRR